MRTTRDATKLGTRAMRIGVAGALVCGIFVFAGLAFGAATFSDAAGDDNAAPDVTSVTVSEPGDGTISVALTVANYQTLPANSWFNIWFDLDSNQGTGDAGDEALVRYVSDGELEFYLWDGAELAEKPATGITGRFVAGALTVTAPKSALGDDSIFGVLVVGSRGQEVGDSEYIASDYAPDRGRSAFTGPTQAAFPDPGDDEDAAPDITSVRVTDAKDGWITFAVSTPNYASLPGESMLILAIDADNRENTGDSGADLLLTHLVGETRLEYWDARTRSWTDDKAPTRVRVQNAGNVITVDIHRSELANAPRFGFAVTSADVDLVAETIQGIDFAPETAPFFHYALANRPAVNLVAARLFAVPARPQAGEPFAINLAVRRSDTNRGITSGTVSCKVLLAGKQLPAKGAVAGGAGRCSVVVPRNATGLRVYGTITVRVAGKTVASDFAYVVR